MRVMWKWLFRGLVVSALIMLALVLWKREELTRLLAVNSLFSEEKIVANFSNMDTAFLHVPVPRGTGPTSPLPYAAETQLPPQVAQWITDRSVTALVVLKDGEIAYENYFLGTAAEDRRISWSVAKSYLSALVGVLLDEGAILRQVLNMASGVTFDEDYLDQSSDINRMGRVLALGGEMDDFAADLTETFAPPGAQYQYVSIDTHVVGMVVRGATGRSVADLLSEKVIAPLGLEYAPYYLTDGVGTAFVLGGLNMTTRDYARFGQMFAQGGMWQGQQIVPADWVAASTVPSAPTALGATGYGYQWWIPAGAPEGVYMARGIYGQYIYVDSQAGVVIATNAADRQFREPGVGAQNEAIFAAIAASL